MLDNFFKTSTRLLARRIDGILYINGDSLCNLFTELAEEFDRRGEKTGSAVMRAVRNKIRDMEWKELR